MRRLIGTWRRAAGLGVVLWAGVVFTQAHAARQQPETIDFARDVQPIVAANCLECHNQDTRKGGLSLASYDDMLSGGRSGAVIQPGKAVSSIILARLTATTVAERMPFGKPPLGANDIATVRRWIDEGARLTSTSPPAPPPWEAPLALERPHVPDVVWTAWSRPLDRLVAAYLSERNPEPALVNDALFARRAYLDVWGLLPSRAELETFIADTAPDKRDRLVAMLLADNRKYAEHWMSFWNDLLRNEDGVTYFSEDNGRKSITAWLLPSLSTNLPYDQFVTKLLNPSAPGDPEGFLIGVNWRGETSAAVTPWMQASQNTSQVFLGVNMKCNACHDSFVTKWKLMDAYSLAAFFSPEPKLQLFRCDVARDQFAEPAFLYPTLNRVPASASLADRRAAAAAIFTDPRNGRMPRTVVNRFWERLLGRGIVANSDEMDGVPWSPEVLDWIASDFVEHRYDLKHLIATVMTSRAYQLPAVARTNEVGSNRYAFAGPEVRRLTAEQFADAIGSITGEWSVQPGAGRGSSALEPNESDPPAAGVYAREWQTPSTHLTRALGRPIRDQITSTRATHSTTLQALELVNGEILTRWVSRGARRMLGQAAPEPASLFNAGLSPSSTGQITARSFDIDVSKASRLWLLVTDTGSNAPERVGPVWSNVELVSQGRVVPLSSFTPVDASGLRAGASRNGDLSVKNPSRLVYDISGRQFTRLRGAVNVTNAPAELGSTLSARLRFFVFDRAPNMDRLIPLTPGSPLPASPVMSSASAVVDRIFWSALQRAPSAAERRAAEAAIVDRAGPARLSASGVADLLWAVLMKPEFQLVY
jgi:hypothetical protein